MKYNELTLTANKNTKRVGRGIAAGQGKTAGRGTKGQGARTGHKKRSVFQGGQRPLVQSSPKAPGFKSKRPATQVVYLDNLSLLKGKEVDNFVLAEEGFIKTPYLRTKVITRGEIDGAVVLKVQAVSKSSLEAIEKAGGSFIQTPVPQREKQNKDTK